MVSLNFKSDSSDHFSLKRSINKSGIQEYFYNNRQLTSEEYIRTLNSLNLQINNFCAY